MPDRVAVVGGGPAGAAAAYGLRDQAAVTLFEAAGALGGRMHTRSRDGCRYDAGANYLTDDDERVNDLVAAAGTDGLVDIEAPVWTFDERGRVGPGRDADERKWTYGEGIAAFPRRLAAAADADVKTGRRVEALDREGGSWTLDTAAGSSGPYDAVVLAVPGPDAASLLRASDGPVTDRLAAAAADLSYRSVLTAALHYPFALDRPYYALVDTSKEHEVGWVGREACKPGHVPAGESLLVVQMGAAWSGAHLDDPDDAVATAAAAHVGALLDDDRLADPDWAEVTRWRHALPGAGLDDEVVGDARDVGLVPAGDWVVGEGRVHLAARSGLDAAPPGVTERRK